MLEYLKSDLYRYEGKTSLKSFIKYYRKNAGFRFLVAFRLVNEKGLWKIIGTILWILRNKQLIQISRKTRIGYGLYISHGGPVVVNPSTQIGDNCNLSQFVTIGSNEGKAAVIGDNVYIGPSCCRSIIWNVFSNYISSTNSNSISYNYILYNTTRRSNINIITYYCCFSFIGSYSNKL